MSTLYESFNDTYNQLPIKIYKHNLDGKFIWTPLHWHRSIEIFVTFDGRINFNIGSDNFNFSETDWTIINSSELHSSRYVNLRDHFQGISILVSHDFVETWLGKDLFFYNPEITDVTEKLKNIATDLYHYDPSLAQYPIIMMSKLFDLFYLLSKHCIQPNKTYSIPLYSEHKKATEFMEYIESNFQENLTLEYIANHFKYSSSYFSRFFKEITGINYYTYLNFVRTHHAAKELLKGQVTLTDCALNNGFPNTKSFINMFKKHYGCTPGKFLNANL